MLKFVFLLTVWTSETPAPAVYVEDYGLTGEDCIARIVAYHDANPTHSEGMPSCEIDYGGE